MFHCDINEVYSRESISKPGRTGPGSGRVKVSSQIYEWTEIPRAHSSHTVVREVSQRADAGCLAREDGWAPPLGFGREGAACLPSKDARIRSGGDGGDGLRLPSFPWDVEHGGNSRSSCSFLQAIPFSLRSRL